MTAVSAVVALVVPGMLAGADDGRASVVRAVGFACGEFWVGVLPRPFADSANALPTAEPKASKKEVCANAGSVDTIHKKSATALK